MDQIQKTHLLVVLIMGLVVGAFVGWVAKSIPPPGPEWVSKAELDKLKADYSKLKADFDKLTGDYNKLKADFDKLKADLQEILKSQIINFLNESKLPIVRFEVEIVKPPLVKGEFVRRILLFAPYPPPFKVYDLIAVREQFKVPPETLQKFNETYLKFLDDVMKPRDIPAYVTWFPKDSPSFTSVSLIDGVTWSLKHDTFIEFVPIKIGRVSPSISHSMSTQSHIGEHERQQISMEAPLRNHFVRSWVHVKSLVTTSLYVTPEKQKAPAKYSFELYIDFRSWFEGSLDWFYEILFLPTVAFGSPLTSVAVEENILEKGLLISSLSLDGDANFFDREFHIEIFDRLEPGKISYKALVPAPVGDFRPGLLIEYDPPDEYKKSSISVSISSSKRVELYNSIREYRGHFARKGSYFKLSGSIIVDRAANGSIAFNTLVSLTVANILPLPDGGFRILPGGFIVHDTNAIYVWDDFETSV